MTVTNEAAERLRAGLSDYRKYGSGWDTMIDHALAAERRAMVERIRAALDAREHDREHPVLRWPVALHDILDAELSASPETDSQAAR